MRFIGIGLVVLGQFLSSPAFAAPVTNQPGIISGKITDKVQSVPNEKKFECSCTFTAECGCGLYGVYRTVSFDCLGGSSPDFAGAVIDMDNACRRLCPNGEGMIYPAEYSCTTLGDPV